MIRVTFNESNGASHSVEVPEGTTLMRAALDNNVPGIEGDCGGLCACATCHVYIDDPRIPVSAPVSSQEESMLSFSPIQRPTSRLSCQISLNKSLDGLQVLLPESQY